MAGVRGFPAKMLVVLAIAGSARAETTLSDAQAAQLEGLRQQIAAQIQLQAFDLLDELVVGLLEAPPFAVETPVVLAEVSVPVGYGSGMKALLENHLSALLLQNPKTGLRLALCPECTAVVAHSGASGTVISRGFDQPEALEKAGARARSRHALFLDLEAEGVALVLRARITSLTPELPIVFAKTLSTSTLRPALLRSGERLKTAAEAQADYVEALSGRDGLRVPIRLAVRTYAASAQANLPVRAIPFLWVQGGVETSLSQARAWTGSASVGVSWLPELHTAFMGQARVSRLLTGAASSLTAPDLYAFVGASILSIQGRSALLFEDEVPSLSAAASQLLETDPQTTVAAFGLGLELRVKNRLSFSAFLESLPAVNEAPAIGRYLDLGILQFHSIGAEVSFWF